ncbi:hypothetical protein AB0H45_16455 [Streptomyces atroolivaceus]|uniref:hypothetical protein n=1 Tax=Streptomyces atroolivaceus TaxID=66869 RepID=UPI0033EA5928
MRELVRRFAESPLRRLCKELAPAPAPPEPGMQAAGPTTRRTGQRPLRGEDSPLVRPYLAAHERQVAEARRGRRTVWHAVQGVDVGLVLSAHGAEAAA